MRLEHTALWATDIERSRAFYQRFFRAESSARYHNPTKAFSSYFLSFAQGGRLELMHTPTSHPQSPQPTIGWAHMALSVGSEQAVDELTEWIKSEGYCCVDGPRRTGDGYYESVVLDPDGNRIEITA
ncbi:VOC family protein [Thaumasiovibrio subtropicus]|uniref:VOC family protein n=1 Tax=Thaumasiovibrio subtropicus TaxID=1891207 RepID=UPI000B360291|nr:VOC family protein [Thaumasiovibrio subtropicus]